MRPKTMLTTRMEMLQKNSLSSTESARLQKVLKNPFTAKICFSGAMTIVFFT